jgi:hypothetical protein
MFLLKEYALKILLIGLSVMTASCAGSTPQNSTKPNVFPGGIKALGYTVQAGAFTDRDKAERLTESLQRAGLDAYYFSGHKGLFRVRFGNYSSGEDALKRALELHKKGIIHDYFIITPSNYPGADSAGGDYSSLRESIVDTAEGFLGTPYRWEGSSPNQGFDCSGLAMTVYKINGLDLPRTTKSQWRAGISVSPDNIMKGDLVFFSMPGVKKTSHVGIYLGNGRFIHAPGEGKTVQIDSLSNPYFKEYYLGARSYLQ